MTKLRLFSLQNPAAGLCSIEIGPTGIAIAYITAGAKSSLKLCEFNPIENPAQVNSILNSIIIRNNLAGKTCNVLLHPDSYKILLVNAPNVPESEYRTAVRWQIKDMISHPLEDAAIDVFSPSETQVRPQKIYVIVAQKSFLLRITGALITNQIKPIAIDIREFAIRNLISTFAPSEETIGFLDFSDESCLMLSVLQGKIIFVRRIPIGIKTLRAANNFNSLSIEIQRSLHYCEAELKQKLPERFLLPPKSGIEFLPLSDLSKELSKEIIALDFSSILQSEKQLGSELIFRCWPVIGGALRKV